MTGTNPKLLSKSRYTQGWQCLKQLYLGVNDPKLATPFDPASQARLDQGTRLGELAQSRWPGGQLVDIHPFKHDDAVRRTRELLADPDTPSLFEAGFTELGVRIRADVLERVGDGNSWDLIEVKTSTGEKPIHDADIAVQAAVIEAAGVNLRRKMLLVIDTSYVRGRGELDVNGLFRLIDRTEEVDGLQDDVNRRLGEMHRVVAEPEAPEIPIGPQCRNPYDCNFFDFCSRGRPNHWALELPGVTLTKLNKFTDAGYSDIADIPNAFSLTSRQQRVRDTVRTGQPWVSDRLDEVLSTLESPIYYLDFETMIPAAPIYPGTGPYQQVPFQWSCHIDIDDGQPRHQEFLADGSGDPRRRLAEELIDCLGDSGSIVVYSSFEATTLRKLAEQYSDLSEPLLAIVDRLWDLYSVINAHYYHPNFHGSLSIKSVLPVMVPELTYDDLEIADGGTAAALFAEIEAANITGIERERVSIALREYCGQDTLAMVKILEKLRALA